MVPHSAHPKLATPVPAARRARIPSAVHRTVLSQYSRSIRHRRPALKATGLAQTCSLHILGPKPALVPRRPPESRVLAVVKEARTLGPRARDRGSAGGSGTPRRSASSSMRCCAHNDTQLLLPRRLAMLHGVLDGLMLARRVTEGQTLVRLAGDRLVGHGGVT